MPTQTVISINRQTPIMGPATFYPRVVVERLLCFRLMVQKLKATTDVTVVAFLPYAIVNYKALQRVICCSLILTLTMR